MEVATLTQERRDGGRRLVQHLIPGCLADADSTRRISAVLIDVSHHGLGLRTRLPLAPGGEMSLLTLHGQVPLRVAWQTRLNAKGAYICGLQALDAELDLEAMLSSFLQ